MLKIIIISSLLVSATFAAHNCSSFSDRNHGFGCELKNVSPNNDTFEVNVMMRDNDQNKTDEDIIWVQIRDSEFVNLPRGVFEKFVNLEKIMIISSAGFKVFNTSYFDKKITLVLMKNTDIEIVGDLPLVGLNELKILSLNYNQITKIHKNAFRDLVKMEKIEIVGNKLEFLDVETFQNNVNLKLVLLYHNKLKVIPADLFSHNKLIESIQLQNNSISQIEKGFYKPLEKLTKADFSSNICISETISLTRAIQWNAQVFKFKDCFNNYALMKSTNDVIDNVRTKLSELDDKVSNVVERVDNDLAVLEGKMKNATELDKFKTNLLDFFEKDKKTFQAQYENDLNNITSHVRTDMMDEIKKNVVDVLEKSQEAQQAQLVSNDFEQFRENFSVRFAMIYLMLFLLVAFVGALAYGMIKYAGIYPFNIQGDNRKLIDAEVC
ncbi:unnamed protein product [Chironomus riparius]|uniref:Uncharacterized protein n=1 Tax=Chironomus riparius TaxID=315576 RepID=A0A9N9RXL4_9DIPT|nr:unnamed protein product [Chironomus riparius]